MKNMFYLASMMLRKNRKNVRKDRTLEWKRPWLEGNLLCIVMARL